MQSHEVTYCWLDPGATTGIAAYTLRSGGSFHSWQLQFREAGEKIEQLARDWSPLNLGYESFAITPGSRVKHDGSALMSIGMARWLCFKHGIAMLPSQPPSARRLGLLHLKTLGWYRPGLGHANDAAGHLATYMIAGNLLPEELKERLRGDSGDIRGPDHPGLHVHAARPVTADSRGEMGQGQAAVEAAAHVECLPADAGPVPRQPRTD